MFEFDARAPNILPIRYRQVALSTELANLEPAWLVRHFTGLEAYMRTRFIVARNRDDTVLLEVARAPSEALFSRIEQVRVLAGVGECCYVINPEIDCGVPSELASIASQHPEAACVIVEGRYSHVSFILNPQPLLLTVLDIVPPFPSKLLDQVQRVLGVAEEWPPIVPVARFIDSRERLAQECSPLPSQVLVPCRGSGIGFDGVTMSYLDERPAAADWTLLGCERSHQIHRWFYDSAPPATVDICPKRFLSDTTVAAPDDNPVLTRCCLLQEGIQDTPQATLVPWGASLIEVREAIDLIVKHQDVAWTPV